MEEFESDTGSSSYPKWLTLLVGEGREEYLLSLRYPFLICLAMYIASFTFGYLFQPRIPSQWLEDLLGGFPDLEKLGSLSFMLFIFINNALKSFIWMFMGILFGIAPLLFMALNGFTLGWLTHYISRIMGLLFVFVAIAPHGVVEFPITFLSSAIGVKFGYTLLNRIRGEGGLTAELKKGLSLFLRRMLLFLLIAAAIEAFITPFIVLLFFQ